MRKHLVVIVRHVSHGKDIQLCFTTTTCNVDWEQNWKGDTASDQASNNGHFQEPQEQITVQRMVVKDMAVWNIEEGAKETKKLVWKFGRSFAIAQSERLFAEDSQGSSNRSGMLPIKVLGR